MQRMSRRRSSRDSKRKHSNAQFASLFFSPRPPRPRPPRPLQNSRQQKLQEPLSLLDAERAANLSDKEYYDAKYAIPCSITGAMAAASGGALGFVFGFGSQIIRGVSPLVKNAAATATSSAPPAMTTRLAAALADGRTSAASFAAFGGIYSAAACAVSRARDVDADPLNGAIAGCITGAALGWKSGPAGMAQSCAMLGGFSYFIDRMQGGQVAQAAEVFVDGEDEGEGEGEGGGGLSLSRQRRRRQEQQQQRRRTRRDSSHRSFSSPDSSCSFYFPSSPGSKCCTVGGPLGAAFASAFSRSPSSSSAAAAALDGNSSDPLSLLVGPQLKKGFQAAEDAARKLGSAVRGAAVEQVRSSRARWEW